MDVARVEQELSAMWRKAEDGNEAAVRACELNLIVACTGPEDAIEATETVARLSERHPGRVLLVTPGYGGDLDAFVSTHCHLGADRRRVCCEQVTLEVPPDERGFVPATLLQLLVADVPVYTWWRRTTSGEDDWLQPLAAMSDRLIVYSANSHDPRRALQRLVRLAWEGEALATVRDLTWVRLEGWREAIASFFDLPEALAVVGRIERLHVSGGGATNSRGVTAASAYIAGWLTSRLGWTPTGRPGVWTRKDGGEVRLDLEPAPGLVSGRIGFVKIETGSGHEAASFSVERLDPGGRLVRLETRCGPHVSSPRVETLDQIADHELLSREIERHGVDPIHLAALRDAARIAGEE